MKQTLSCNPLIIHVQPLPWHGSLLIFDLYIPRVEVSSYDVALTSIVVGAVHPNLG